MSELRFVHEDRAIVVVVKPSGLLSIPGAGPGMQDCVVNRVRARHASCIEQPAAHRLDMDTSGLMVLGLTTWSHRHLSVQFERGTVRKVYVALLDGVVAGESGEIELAFRLDPDNRPYQVHDPERGRIGVTLWRRLGVRDGRTLIEFTPLTGRTHQLRVHAAHELGLGHPIVGDRLYGSGTGPGQLKLHATRLEFDHPETGERMRFDSPATFTDGLVDHVS